MQINIKALMKSPILEKNLWSKKCI
jgi:hypothetical protein